MAKKIDNPHETEKILLSAFVGVESAHAFSAFNPSIFTIRSLAVPQQQENLIRAGYIPSIVFSGALGGIVSLLVKSKLPIIFALGTSAFMIGVYEMALRAQPEPVAAKPVTVKPPTQSEEAGEGLKFGILEKV